MSKEEIVLKPCPHCGGEARAYGPQGKAHGYDCVIKCIHEDDCGAMIVGETRHEAAERWNKRFNEKTGRWER